MAPTTTTTPSSTSRKATAKKVTFSPKKAQGKRHHAPVEHLGGLKKGALINLSRRAGMRETKEDVVSVAGKIGRAFASHLARTVLLAMHAQGEGRTVMPRHVDFALNRMQLTVV